MIRKNDLSLQFIATEFHVFFRRMSTECWQSHPCTLVFHPIRDYSARIRARLENHHHAFMTAKTPFQYSP
jgi:hypothetical protein